MTSYVLHYLFWGLMPIIPLFGVVIILSDFALILRKDRKYIHDHLAGTSVINIIKEYE